MSAQPDFRVKEMTYYNSYFYTPQPMRTLIVQVDLADEVDGEILQAAVDDTLERMPYLADAFVEKDGDFFYAENPLLFEVAEGGLRATGGPETNWHNLDVTYEGKTISFSMYHSFCDGMGQNIFVEATLYHYFCRKDGVSYPTDGIRAKGTAPLPGEELDANARFYDAQMTPELGALLIDFTKECYKLPESFEGLLDHVIAVPVRVSEEKFVAFARANGSSPAPALATLMTDAVFAVHPECDKELAAFIPISSRKGLKADNTFKNCTSAARMMIAPDSASVLSFSERARAARDYLRACVDPAYLGLTTNITTKDYLDLRAKTTSFKERYDVLSSSTLLSNNTFLIDYVGGLRLNGYADRVMATRYLAGALGEGRPISLYVTATGGYFDMALVRAFESDVYVRAFCDQLAKHGIAYEVGEPMQFLNPQNGLIEGLGLL